MVLTRIFSVVFWYHFAFLAISIALAGFAASGLVLHAQRARLSTRGPADLVRGAVAFQLAVLVATALALRAGQEGALPKIVLLAPVYLATALPFYFAGWVVGLALARWPERAQSIYAADLAGAAVGALAAPLALGVFDAGGAAILSGVLAGAGALFFATRETRRLAAGVLAVSIAALAVQATLRPLRVRCPKGGCESEQIVERWNHFSRVAVYPPTRGARAGLSSKYAGPYLPVRFMNIDASAATPIVGFDGKLESLESLKWDLTSLPYRVRAPKHVFVAGAGGGPDLLTAHAFGATSVVAAEINPLVVSMAEDRFGDFSGHPYRLPGVSLALDDARSVLQSRPDERYDLVQMSLVDTWAAAAAGAFALTENNLYTTESFRLYLRHLAPGGIVSVSRWYRPSSPQEMLRLVVLAREALEKEGVTDPKSHILSAAWFAAEDHKWGVGLAMFSRDGFTPAEREAFREGCATMADTPLWDGDGGEPAIGEALGAPDLHAWLATQALNLDPPTDDWPFFFQATRLTHWLTGGDYLSGGVPILVSIVAATGAITLILLILARSRMSAASLAGVGRKSAVAAFALGLGFIVVEVGLLQRFLLLLGHPTYSMAVVLPSILLAAAAGSRFGARRPATACLAAAGAALVAAWALLPGIHALLGEPRALRVALSVVVLAAIAFPMGVPFPALLRVVGERAEGANAWLWAVNGAASVFGSALAMLVSIFCGFSWSLSLGAAAYVLAAAATAGIAADAVSDSPAAAAEPAREAPAPRQATMP